MSWHQDLRYWGLDRDAMAPHMRQVVAKEDFAVLVRGQDRFGHFQTVPPPTRVLREAAIAWHARILDAQNEAIYAGAKQART